MRGGARSLEAAQAWPRNAVLKEGGRHFDASCAAHAALYVVRGEVRVGDAEIARAALELAGGPLVEATVGEQPPLLLPLL